MQTFSLPIIPLVPAQALTANKTATTVKILIVFISVFLSNKICQQYDVRKLAYIKEMTLSDAWQCLWISYSSSLWV